MIHLPEKVAACGNAKIHGNEPLRMGFGCDVTGSLTVYPPVARHRDLKPSRRGFFFFEPSERVSKWPAWAELTNTGLPAPGQSRPEVD